MVQLYYAIFTCLGNKLFVQENRSFTNSLLLCPTETKSLLEHVEVRMSVLFKYNAVFVMYIE